jgi:Domain of unknown function (DUF4157)
MTTHARSDSRDAEHITPASSRSDLLQRKCACGSSAGLTGQCKECGEQRLIQGVQTQLTISQPGDRFEQEADRVAEQVMRSPQAQDLAKERYSNLPSISRWVAGSNDQINRQATVEEEEEEEKPETASLLSLKQASGSTNTATPGVASQIRTMRGGGQPLDFGLRQFFEPRFGHDFSQVRVHTGSDAAQTTKALNARAYTLGSDIAFASSQYQPETPAGRLLLAHELTHVVQQGDQVQTLMRACDCSKMGASKPSSAEDTYLQSNFPQLKTSDYCVTAAKTNKYNCFAWSVGDTSKWLDKEVDTIHGDNDGKLEFSDFDSMYDKRGLKPVIGQTPANPEVALYGKGATPTHAARRRADMGCGNFESKLGEYLRISHYPQQLEGGSVYGDINRYYVPKSTPKKP